MTDSNVIIKELYPLVEKSLIKNDTKFRNNISKFINDRHKLMFDIAPYDMIYFNQTDVDAMFQSLGIEEKECKKILDKCFWNNMRGEYNPQCIKEPYVPVLMMAIRYYLKKNKQKEAELVSIYLAFSGKFYASVHSMTFGKLPPRKYQSVMDFVVNNMLTDKYDLKKTGSVFGAISSMCNTWLTTYNKLITKSNISDDDIAKKLVQQLRDREKSFMKNIGKLYYEAFTNRNYLNYETDNLSEEEFRLTSNDSATAARVTENTVTYLTSTNISLDTCNNSKNEYVSAVEIKNIMETILLDKDNLPAIRRVVNIIICDFMRNNPGKYIKSIDFVSYSAKPKPNTKDKYIIELKEIILNWLDENSPAYRKRKSRKATQISYYKSVLLYIIFSIMKNVD